MTYTAADGWTIGETPLAAGTTLEQYSLDGWLARNDNPRPGHFPHAGTHDDVDEVVYTIPLADLGDLDDIEELLVAAHAVVTGPQGGETAWSEGTRFTEQGNWAMWFAYELP